jgi:hypothetical protein
MILNKSQLVNNINSEISDQAFGQITPYDIRHNFLDIVDSIHNLTEFQDLKSKNFSTPGIRSTRVGQLSIDKLGLDGYLTEDNTAVGYASLQGNYKGIKNTAIGSFSLHCNVYGEENIALGFNSLAGNTVGHRNIGIGNYTLHFNKAGSGNVAIGNAAGYYVDRFTSNKLFIASYAGIGSGYICTNPKGDGLVPLIYGDFATTQLGIGINSLHAYGKLQVAGDISPSINDTTNIGHPLYNWSSIFLSRSVVLSNNTEISVSGNNQIIVKGNLSPSGHDLQNFGSISNRWNSGRFKDIYVDGTAYINTYESITTTNYFNKTIYLATRNDGSPRLKDEELINAGIVVKSSGTNYLRDYSISLFPEQYGMPCFQGVFDRTVWRSNISFQVPGNGYIKADNIVSYHPDAFYAGDCYGLFFNSGITYISRKNVLSQTENPAASDSPLCGISNINFIANSGSNENYFVGILSPQSGVSVGQRFLTGITNRVKDANNGYKDKINGFEIKYIDDSLYTVGSDLTDRFAITAYNNTSTPVNSLLFMKNNPRGLLGISNITEASENLLPETSFNVRSSNDAIALLSAENTGSGNIAALQLAGINNCLNHAFEISYINGSGFSDINLYRNSNKNLFLRFYDGSTTSLNSNAISIFAPTSQPNAMLTIGDVNNNAVISLRRNESITYNPSKTASYGKLYVKPKSSVVQSDSIFMIDGDGNILDLYVNKFDVNDARGVYTDSRFNTFAGMCPLKRDNLNSSCRDNSIFGYNGLNSITTGYSNTCIGSNSATSVTNGFNNIILGQGSAGSLRSGSNNIFIGNSIANSTIPHASGNIVIGTNSIGNGNILNTIDNLFIGKSDSLILLHGVLGPAQQNKFLSLPSGGVFHIYNSTHTEVLTLTDHKIEIKDPNKTYPNKTFTFTFAGSSLSGNLLSLNYSNGPMGNVENYASSTSSFARIDGDIRLRGSLRFSDGTSLSSSNFLNDIAQLGTDLNGVSGIARSALDGLNSAFNNLLVECFVPIGIAAPTSLTSPTSGIMEIKNSSWSTTSTAYLVNRDPTMVIHNNAYIIAVKINGNYRPIWISSEDTTCVCCPN